MVIASHLYKQIRYNLPVMRRALLIVMKIAIVLGLILIGFELAIASYPHLAGAVVWLASSKGSQCNLLETISTVAFEQERAKAMHRIQASTRIVAQDGELRLLDIPERGRSGFSSTSTRDSFSGYLARNWLTSTGFQPICGLG